MNTQFYDSNVATVDYQILFTKRDFEAVLENKTTTVAKAMTGSGFASWKIAEFIRRTDRDGIDVPEDWDDKKIAAVLEDVGGGRKRLKKGNLEFLQVEYQVLSTMERKPEKYEKDKVDALKGIVDKLDESNKLVGGG